MLKRRSVTDGCAEPRLGDQLIPLAMVVLLRLMSSLRITVAREECVVDNDIAPRNGFIVEVTFLRQPDSGLEHPVRVSGSDYCSLHSFDQQGSPITK